MTTALSSRFRQFLGILALRPVPFWTGSRLRKVMRGLVFVGYLYVAHFLVLILIQDRLAFPGWTFSRNWVRPREASVEEIELTTEDGNQILCRWLPLVDWKPVDGVVLYAHGNGRNLSHFQGNLERCRQGLKRPVFAFDYPGYGRSTGTPSEESCYAAARAAYEYLVNERGVPPKEIILFGESMGGAMATELATHYPCRMLVLWGAYNTFPDAAQSQFFWLPVRGLVRHRFDNEAKLRTIQAPVFIGHGTWDFVVPPRMAERNYAAAAGPRRLHLIDRQPHHHPRDPAFYLAIREFLDERQPN